MISDTNTSIGLYIGLPLIELNPRSCGSIAKPAFDALESVVCPAGFKRTKIDEEHYAAVACVGNSQANEGNQSTTYALSKTAELVRERRPFSSQAEVSGSMKIADVVYRDMTGQSMLSLVISTSDSDDERQFAVFCDGSGRLTGMSAVGADGKFREMRSYWPDGSLKRHVDVSIGTDGRTVEHERTWRESGLLQSDDVRVGYRTLSHSYFDEQGTMVCAFRYLESSGAIEYSVRIGCPDPEEPNVGGGY